MTKTAIAFKILVLATLIGAAYPTQSFAQHDWTRANPDSSYSYSNYGDYAFHYGHQGTSHFRGFYYTPPYMKSPSYKPRMAEQQHAYSFIRPEGYPLRQNSNNPRFHFYGLGAAPVYRYIE